MKIAVLMSTYNGHNYLSKQLESIAQQTVSKYITVYIRDDGSKDDTVEIIKRWKDRLNIVLYVEENLGPAKSFWTLLTKKEIRADFFAFSDQDDYWDQDKLEVAINYLQGNTHLYTCNCRLIDENGKVIREKNAIKDPVYSLRRMFVAGAVQGCTMVFTNKLREFILQQDISCVPIHDLIVMIYAIEYGNVYWDHNPRLGYRVHSSNVMAQTNKNIFEKISTTIWNWKNNQQNSMTVVAKELIRNIKDLPKSDRDFLELIAAYKKHKIHVLSECRNVGVGRNSMRSFTVRIILGLY